MPGELPISRQQREYAQSKPVLPAPEPPSERWELVEYPEIRHWAEQTRALQAALRQGELPPRLVRTAELLPQICRDKTAWLLDIPNPRTPSGTSTLTILTSMSTFPCPGDRVVLSRVSPIPQRLTGTIMGMCWSLSPETLQAVALGATAMDRLWMLEEDEDAEA